MSPAVGATLAMGALCATLALTRGIRAYARRRHLLDHPNARSAHSTPTPRLGGIGIMIPFLAGGFALSLHGATDRSLLRVLFGTAVIAGVGLIDDLRPLAARWRFGVQLIAALAVVFPAGPAIGAALAPFDLLLPYPMLAAAAVLWIVWATNLYNFMDGIDGLAGGQAIAASIGLAAAAFTLGSTALGWALVVLAASSAGFLAYNRPKATIFMGDVGSTAIGFFLASSSFAATGSRPIPVLAVVLALALFVMDATTTLVRRVLRGERWFAAHRTHLYQRPLACGLGHAPITYTAWMGMVIVGAFAATYPVATAISRGVMLLVATGIFVGFWCWVRSIELKTAARTS